MSNTLGNLTPDKVTKVFPCVSRENDLHSKLISEENITSLVRMVTDNNSFVINDSLSDFEFVIDGYYFKVNIAKFFSDNPGPIFAQISYKSASPYRIIEGDTDGAFGGIIFSTTEPSEGSPYLQLWDGEKVPPNSKVKFTLQSTNISFDFGELS